MDILLDGLHKLFVLFGGIGIIHPQITKAAIFFRSTKVDGQRFAVANMQIAVWLWRKAGMNRHAGELAARGDIFLNKGMDEISALRGLLLHGFDLVSHGCHSLLCK